MLFAITVAAGAFAASSLAGGSAPVIDGYLLYLKSDQKLGDIELKKNDAIAVRPKLLQIKDEGRRFSAEIEFRVMKNGLPMEPLLKSWVDIDALSRTKPLSRTNTADWTMEPAKVPTVPLPPPRPPIVCENNVCTVKADAPLDPLCPDENPTCLKAIELIRAFHDSALCSAVNAQVDTNGDSRRVLFLKAWDDFITAKAGHHCERSSTDEACLAPNRARELDILTRTAVFEAEPPNTKIPAEQTAARSRCEIDVILLTLRTRAFDPTCAKSKAGTRPTKFGCSFTGDFVGVCTKPNELNIWADLDTLNTRVTGCFLRSDAETLTWKDKGGRKSFMARREQYFETLKRSIRVTDPSRPLDEMFDISSTAKTLEPREKKRLLGLTRFYYHPVGMAKCDPATYDQSAFVAAGYAIKGEELFLLMGTRFVPQSKDGKTTIAAIYEPESNLPAGLRAEFNQMTAGAVVPDRFIDRTNNNRCWPALEKTTCATDPSLGPRKAPKWAITKNNETYRLSCRADRMHGEPPGELTWTWNGLCDPGLVVVPEFVNFYR